MNYDMYLQGSHLCCYAMIDLGIINASKALNVMLIYLAYVISAWLFYTS